MTIHQFVFGGKRKKIQCSMTASTRSEYKKGKLHQRIYSTPQSATKKCKKRQLQALFYAFQNIDIVTRTCFTSSPLKLHQRRGIIRIFVGIK